jgi:Ca-activated chloride channel family protein
MTRPAKANAEVTPPPQVLIKAMSRLSIYRLQEQAQKDLAAGNIDQATQKLNNVAVQLLSAGENGLAQTVMLELDNLKKGETLSQEAKKRIKYSTRALLLPTDEENL